MIKKIDDTRGKCIIFILTMERKAHEKFKAHKQTLLHIE